jgi:hypothetical protein
MYCHSCHLLLELGDYHFHARRDWSGANLYGCLKCGTQYRVLRSTSTPEGRFHEVEQQPEPLDGIIKDELYEPTKFFDYQPYISSKESLLDWNRIPHDVLEESLKLLVCTYCKSQDSLSSSTHDFSLCPRCGSDKFEIVQFWMT